MTPTSIHAGDIRGVIGYMPTPVREDIEIDRHVTDAVDLDESARAADILVRDGVSGLCLNGTFGELPSLTWDELRTFTATVVEAVAGRVPVFAGATTLNTRDTIARARTFRDLGADGLMLGRPMMSSLSDQNIVRFYQDVSAELPELAIFLYDDAEAFKRPIVTDVYAELAKIPQIVACKYRSRLLIGSLAHNTYEDDFEAVAGRIRLLTHEGDWPFVYKLFGETACWSSTVSAGPAPVMALQDALLSDDWDTVKTIQKELDWALEGLIPTAGFESWHVHKIPTLKARFHAAGYIKAGPALPPYTYIPEERLALARELGQRARTLQEKYAQAALV